MKPLNDIIAAIATPIGEGGISVIRVSGKGAIELVANMLKSKHSLTAVSTHTAHLGYFINKDGDAIDEVITTVFKAPHSYTAEDVVEISCHGGLFVTRKILDSVLDAGARLAEPGEFTKRAFLNGRIDLSQAEAVADLVRSRSEVSHRISLMQLQGRLSSKINEIRERVLNLCSLMELELDFVEEGLEFTDKTQIAHDLKLVIGQLGDLINSYKQGKIFREGVRVVLAGRPNVGKSSILNALLNENRAIVTDVPGTTRDVLEENVNLNGVLFTLIDTAGLRESNDIVEREGILRSEYQIKSSDLALFILEANKPSDQSDIRAFTNLKSHISQSQDIIIVVNKIDLLENDTIEVPAEFRAYKSIRISAKTGAGLFDLSNLLVKTALKSNGVTPEHSLLVTNNRHKESLCKAMENIEKAMNELIKGQSNEFVALYLRSGLDSLGEITGAVTTDDIINNIFSKFCIGK